MQAKTFLSNTAFAQNSGGYQDVIKYRFKPYCNTAGAVTAANNLLAAITAERNNVHTELADGIVEVAPTIVAAAADDGGKMRYIARELITSIEASAPFGVGLVTDKTKEWLNITGQSRDVQYTEIGIFGDFVDGVTPLIANTAARTTMLDLRAATIAAAYALWDAVDTL